MSSSRIAPFRAIWRWLTEPVASIVELEARHRARAVAATLILTLVLVSIPLLRRIYIVGAQPALSFILIVSLIAYGLSRSRYYRIGGMIAICTLWLLPTYGVLIGFADTTTFVLSSVRLMLLALLLTYVVFSLRASVVVALLIGISLLLMPPAARSDISETQFAVDFLQTAGAVFFIFVITRQYDIEARQQVEEAQRATEQRYRAIVETQSEFVSRWLPDTTLTFVNEPYCHYFHTTREKLIGTRIKDLVPPADLRLLQDAIATITPELPTVTYENRFVTRSGHAVWQQWTNHAIYDPQGRIIEYQSIGRDITERKLAEAALSASEARYRAIVEIQTEMICRWLPDETLTFVNEAYCRYFGMTREALIGSVVMAMIFEEDLPLVRRMIGTIDCDHPAVTYQHRVMNTAGEIRWHQWTDQAVFDSAGRLVEYQSVGRDVTDLKRAEDAERRQREFAEALSSTAALISSTLNLEEVLDRILNQIAAANPLNSAEVILIEGHTAYVARSHGYRDPKAHQAVMDMRFSLETTRNLREMIETGRPIIISDVLEYPGWAITKMLPTMRSALGAPIRLQGETIGFLSITSATPGAFTEQDASQLQAFADQAAIAIRNARLYAETSRYADELERLVKQRTAELELAHQRLSAMLEGTGEGIFYTEAQKFQYVNAAFCRLTGYTEAELIGQPIALLGDPVTAEKDAERLRRIREAAVQGNIWRGETRFRRKDGLLLDAALTVAILGDPRAESLRAVTVVRDISREKALQLQRSNLVAYASHELRTPITNMKTRLYLLRRRPEFLEDHLAILDEVTERMRQLVEDLLDISRLEHGLIPLRRNDLSLQSVIRSVVTLQQPEAERKNLSLRSNLPDEPIFVSGDRERLIQVITNLVTNAINYTPAGGAVSVAVSAEDGSAQIEVQDTGIGIAPENLPHIFQPFYRVVSEVEGTGLGLSIAKEIIEMHEGALAVRSEPGHGSTFIVTLPLLKPLRVN